jgi:hypothetical protein
MNHYQSTVLWIGLALIAMNLALRWTSIMSILTAKPANTIQNVNLNTSAQPANMMKIPFVVATTPASALVGPSA